MPKDKKIVFIDRDGVINKQALPHQYITKVKDFKFNRGIFKLLQIFKKAGYEFIIVTNQRGIARKMLTEKDLSLTHQFMTKELRKRGLEILDIFYCPHDLDACNCRKPKPGLLEQACSKYKINLRESVLVSDSPEDILMGKKFGIGKNYLVRTDKPKIIC